MTQLAAFASAVWDTADIIELRAIMPRETQPEGPAPRSVWMTAGEIGAGGADGWAKKLNAAGWGIYAGANPRRELGKAAADVTLARCLFVDFDGGITPAEALAVVADRCLPPPSLVVASGHGVHCWWRLAEPMTDLAVWSGRQRALIALLGSDKAIHDPPRVMRLPGFINTKPPAANVAVVGGSGVAYPMTAFPAAVDTKHGQSGDKAGTSLNGSAANLSRATVEFMVSGATEGERNGRLFAAACDFAGNGLDEGTAEARLLPPATACGLAEPEARAAIRSAYTRPRTPARPTGGGPVDDQDWGELGPEPEAPPTGKERHGFGNVKVECREIKQPGGEVKSVEVTVYRRVDDIGRSIRHLTQGWPKTMGGLPFVVRKTKPGELPSVGSVRTLARPADLFAWIGEVTEPHWTEKACYSEMGGKRSPPTKDEFYSHLKSSGDTYSTVSVLPHHPLVPGVYYLPCELPEVETDANGRPLTPTLDAFCAILNPDTEQDRMLLRAMILTLFWGGPCGKRPAFVLCSEHGKGSGKTSTAETIAAIAGGHFAIGAKEEWSQTAKRLMSDRAMQTRAILIDNVKGRLGGQDVESLITSEQIEGWRAYHGDFSRPNLSTIIITSNTPTLTRDLATRTVLVKIGRQRHSQSFQRLAAEFTGPRRPAMVAECIALLAAKPVSEVTDANRDRFMDWQDGVLCCLPNADALAALVVDRRDGVDADAEEAGAVAKAIATHLRDRNQDPGRGTHRITRDEMRDLLIKAKVVDDGMTKRGLHTWIGNMLGSDGELAPLIDDPNRDGGRCWKWLGERYDPPESDLPPI